MAPFYLCSPSVVLINKQILIEAATYKRAFFVADLLQRLHCTMTSDKREIQEGSGHSGNSVAKLL